MKKSDVLSLGLMLFALFFGAGNLIFPPYLGMEAGESFVPAIAGFIVTGVSLPFIGVLAIGMSKGITSIGAPVHPAFGLALAVMIYLAIGPFFGIPRGAGVAYEMGVVPFLGEPSGLSLLLFTVLFFSIVYGLSLNPTKLVDRIGQWLTPALLLAILALCVAAFWQLDGLAGQPAPKYSDAPFMAGFVEGYLTMDTIAALAFGIVVVNALREKGVQSKRKQVQYTAAAGAIAALSLAFVYGSIGWIGVHFPGAAEMENGAAILTAAAAALFGPWGNVLLGVIVALACLTTCIGLTSAAAQFFAERVPRLSYKQYVQLFTVVSFLLANLGLSTVISVSVPVLVMLYPTAIVLILLSFVNGPRLMYTGAVLLTAVYSLYDGLTAFGVPTAAFANVIGWVPFFDSGLGWVVPAIVGAAIGALIGKMMK